eukprot:3021775-Pyramimonas_sp.AAC.1
MTGKAVMEERGETGPLRPVHVREAFRRISAEGKHRPNLWNSQPNKINKRLPKCKEDSLTKPN